MVVKLARVEDGQGQPREVRFQSLRAHQIGELDVVEAIVVRQIRGGELHHGHQSKENRE